MPHLVRRIEHAGWPMDGRYLIEGVQAVRGGRVTAQAQVIRLVHGLDAAERLLDDLEDEGWIGLRLILFNA